MDEEDFARLMELMDKFESEGLDEDESEEFSELAAEYSGEGG